MEYINFNKIETSHRETRIKYLSALHSDINFLTSLNTALLDNRSEAESIKKQNEIIKYGDSNFKLIDVAELINNKSRLKVVYLICFLESQDKIKLLFEYSNFLSSKGHDVLLYSHCPKPEWVNCSGSFFLVHPDSKLSEIISGGDIVITSAWHMAADALKVNAPINYHFIHNDYDLLEYLQLSQDEKKAIDTAFALPFKLITTSKKTKQQINTLFSRDSIVINAPSNKNTSSSESLDKKKKSSAPFRPFEKELQTSANATIQAIRI